MTIGLYIRDDIVIIRDDIGRDPDAHKGQQATLRGQNSHHFTLLDEMAEGDPQVCLVLERITPDL